MNERIQETLMQAGIYDGREGLYWCGKEHLEKFAELIVRECIEWCDAHATINGTAQQVRASIKQHFGVE